MRKTVFLVAVLVVLLISTATAYAFDGARNGYRLVSDCAICHDTDAFPGAPAIVPEWAETAHSNVGDWTASEANQYPIHRGPSCAGCHSSNYDPSKAAGMDDGASITGYPHENTGGDDAFSEPYIGCSACHYDLSAAHGGAYGELANAEICGQCHNRYSRNDTSYQPLPSVPSGIVPSALNPSYPVGYNPFATPLADVIQTASPDNGLGGWWSGGQSARAHGEGALQYAEWSRSAHSESLDSLKALGLPDSVAANCLECHSADYRIMEEAGKPVPTQSEAKYGDTCVACHTPHGGEETPATWNEERNAQLIMPQDELCSSCHNGELAEGEKEFAPGEEVHHPMDEVMDGRGAIDVPQIPSVHRKSCVECHMVPTGYEHDGAAGTSANHLWRIVTPEEAASQTFNTATGPQNMPHSACSTCHGKSGDPLATYLQTTLDTRQAFIMDMVDAIWAELDDAAARMGYADTDAAHTALSGMDEAMWNDSELAFMSAFTNVEIAETEGSYGIHNWAYSNAIVNKAMEQAESVKWEVAEVTITSPKVSVPNGTGKLNYGQSTTISGMVVLPAGADPSTLLGGQVRLWFKPANGSTYQPIKQSFLGGLFGTAVFDEYTFTVMPWRSGRYVAEFVGTDMWSSKMSMENIGLNVAYRATISRPRTTVRLNGYVKFTGRISPVDFAAGTAVKIQRKKGSGAWKNWTTASVKSNGTYSISKKMTRTGTYYFRPVFRADADHLQGIGNRVKVIVQR